MVSNITCKSSLIFYNIFHLFFMLIFSFDTLNLHDLINTNSVCTHHCNINHNMSSNVSVYNMYCGFYLFSWHIPCTRYSSVGHIHDIYHVLRFTAKCMLLEKVKLEHVECESELSSTCLHVHVLFYRSYIHLLLCKHMVNHPLVSRVPNIPDCFGPDFPVSLS